MSNKAFVISGLLLTVMAVMLLSMIVDRMSMPPHKSATITFVGLDGQQITTTAHNICFNASSISFDTSSGSYTTTMYTLRW